ncbi:Cu(I)-responsive transcriptional regulator [Acinetobacter sp. ESL0695]|uniref:Cu(I)-responsive transcriptional regulator n=1 Tax=Acinetobacter pollinis TaxID=2605270 RepID=A0ABU6DPP9_9GAMM|nr:MULTISPECIES: Cu(I)-responsive transcriptional regulator [Acinetobacter]MEB5475844.1 Cu(I)-responsive transcriptional regulator [Acinetobacter pollinis]WEV48230.1 Cu(I)-responsive transcriptional regulator [Acinetobacter sp. ESL0695]
MNIGQVSKQTGLSNKMIRYYESIGLLPKVQRTEAGYRIYNTVHIQTLHFILHAKALNFSTDQTKALLQLWHNKDRHSGEVKHLALEHIEQLKNQIVQLEHMVEVLQETAACCSGNEKADCPILNKIEQGEKSIWFTK